MIVSAHDLWHFRWRPSEAFSTLAPQTKPVEASEMLILCLFLFPWKVISGFFSGRRLFRQRSLSHTNQKPAIILFVSPAFPVCSLNSKIGRFMSGKQSVAAAGNCFDMMSCCSGDTISGGQKKLIRADGRGGGSAICAEAAPPSGISILYVMTWGSEAVWYAKKKDTQNLTPLGGLHVLRSCNSCGYNLAKLGW